MGELRTIFTNIYNKDVWGHGSGPGSLPENAALYVSVLNWLIKEYNVTSVLDVGCGNWMFSEMINYQNVDYLGIDIVPNVIEQNIKKFQRSNLKFELQDCTSYTSEKVFDMVIIKDVLQHLSYENCHKILHNVKYKMLIVTNDLTAQNTECIDGDHRPLNITIDPFNLKSLFEFTFPSSPFRKHTVVTRE